jgi:hypothetical protein
MYFIGNFQFWGNVLDFDVIFMNCMFVMSFYIFVVMVSVKDEKDRLNHLQYYINLY